MIKRDGKKIIEYNKSLGDKEWKVLMMRIKRDMIEIINDEVEGRIDEV